MNFFFIGAAVIAGFFVLNIFIFISRILVGHHGNSPAMVLRTRKLSKTKAGNYLFMVALWVIGFALPIISPDSVLGRALAQPWALPSVVAWSMFASVIVVVILHVARKLRIRNGN